MSGCDFHSLCSTQQSSKMTLRIYRLHRTSRSSCSKLSATWSRRDGCDFTVGHQLSPVSPLLGLSCHCPSTHRLRLQNKWQINMSDDIRVMMIILQDVHCCPSQDTTLRLAPFRLYRRSIFKCKRFLEFLA